VSGDGDTIDTEQLACQLFTPAAGFRAEAAGAELVAEVVGSVPTGSPSGESTMARSAELVRVVAPGLAKKVALGYSENGGRL
jgi:hypothetical protein